MQKKRKKKKSNENVIIAILVAMIVIVTSMTVVTLVKNKKESNNREQTLPFANSSSESSVQSESGGDESSSEVDFPAVESTSERISVENKVTSSEETEKTTEPERSESGRIIVDIDSVEWNLIVVNMEREIPQGYDPETKEVLDSGYELDARVTPYYEEMYRAGKKDGVTLTPFSGHRSYERQRINYNNLTETYMSRYGIGRKEAAEKAAKVILPPGTSEHNIGIAMDICNTYDSFANSAEYAWLMENAHKYGFILRYPKEKEDVTGIVYEPWHWRFVGVEYAEKIKNSGLCLEEYLDSVGINY